MNEAPKPPTYFTDDHARSMLLRDYFAAKSLPIAAKYWLVDFYIENPDEERTGLAEDANLISADAYVLADAMLEARRK